MTLRWKRAKPIAPAALAAALCLIVAALTACGCGGDGSARRAGELPRWIVARPALADRSTWSLEVDATARPDVRALGPVGVGNGRVFGLLGNGYPLGTWHNLGGPTYHRPFKWFSDKTPRLRAGGDLIEPAREALSYVRRSPVAIVEAGDGRLDWTSVNFAPRGTASPRAEEALLSVWIVRNRSPRRIADVALEFEGVLARFDGAGLAEGDTSGRHLYLRPLEPSTAPEGGESRLSIPLGALGPGEERVTAVAIAFVDGRGSPQSIFDALAGQGVDALLEATLAWWRDWFARVARIESPDPAFNDLFDALVLSIKVNQAVTGALSQMSQYAYAWMRDTHGPAIFFPRIGLIDDFRDMLDYLYGAAVRNGDIANALPADWDLSSLPPPPDWRALPSFTGRTRAESPSFFVIEHEAYEHASGDSSLSASRFDLLWHALFQQHFVDGCLQPYSGDETFEDVKEASFGENILSEPDESLLSSYSSFAMIRAARYLEDVARRLGRTDDAARLADLTANVQRCLDEVFWMPSLGRYAVQAATATRIPDPRPYEDVSTMPLWLEVLDPGEPKAIANFDSLLATLGRPGGTIASPLAPLYKLVFRVVDFGVQTGMSHAYWLVNLDRMFHPLADEAFRRWKDVVTPSGFTDEALSVDDYGHLQVLREPIGIVCDVSARYRSWESGIVGHALLTHLTGYDPDLGAGRARLAPHLPPEWDRVAWRGLSYGRARFDLEIRRRGAAGRDIILATDASASFGLDLEVPLEGTFVSATVDGAAAGARAAINRYGRTVVRLDPIAVPAGRETRVTLDAR